MEKEFVPYEQSLALKELGFNEPCFGYHYTLNGKNWEFAEKSKYYSLDDEINIGGNFTLLAPLYQQAFRWFREKHRLTSSIRTSFNIDFYYEIYIDHMNEMMSSYYKTYEEAELECLKKLIEIIKLK